MIIFHFFSHLFKRGHFLFYTDFGAPWISCLPDNITVMSGDDCGSVNVTWVEPIASDDGEFSLTSNYAPGDDIPYGVNEIIYTAVDADGNVANASFIITVEGKFVCLFNRSSVRNTLGSWWTRLKQKLEPG